MAGQVQLAVLSLFVLTAVSSIHGQLLSNEDTPPLIDRFLQVIWEPSSLIRMWVGLDQLYNILLSWKGVAKKLVTLPFGEGRSMDHVSIQEPRNLKYHKPSVASQLDRFNEIYSRSNLSPIVAHARSHQRSNYALGSHLKPLENYADPAARGLPPAFLFQPQEVFLNPASMDLWRNANELSHSLPFENKGDLLLMTKLLELQRQENLKILQNRRHFNQYGGLSSLVPKHLADPSGVLNASPQERLSMFLKLMKTLGDMHSSDIARESLETSDS